MTSRVRQRNILALALVLCTAPVGTGFTEAFRSHSTMSSPNAGTFRLSKTSLDTVALAAMAESDQNHSSSNNRRHGKRKLFSLTALRATMRAATGISLTAVYASTLAATGQVIRQTMKFILSIFPAWFRYFLQPFLILYYVPLFVLREMSDPGRNQGVAKHEALVKSWKQAVETADKNSSYWPLHVTQEGTFEKDLAELDVNEAIAESVEVAMEEKEKDMKR